VHFELVSSWRKASLTKISYAERRFMGSFVRTVDKKTRIRLNAFKKLVGVMGNHLYVEEGEVSRKSNSKLEDLFAKPVSRLAIVNNTYSIPLDSAWTNKSVFLTEASMDHTLSPVKFFFLLTDDQGNPKMITFGAATAPRCVREPAVVRDWYRDWYRDGDGDKNSSNGGINVDGVAGGAVEGVLLLGLAAALAQFCSAGGNSDATSRFPRSCQMINCEVVPRTVRAPFSEKSQSPPKSYERHGMSAR
ncbi:hypothetical protein PpBr36_02029, partial [Pyricularia pennisetigena]|uniref:hypothetical protein n=1 Tax=Pyricularia pennisetigena TaxID=1578925 RepID=UPI00115304BA